MPGYGGTGEWIQYKEECSKFLDVTALKKL